MQPYMKKPMYLYLLLLTICASGGLQVWRTLFNNFAVEIVGLQGDQIGIIQSIREVPGFLSLLVVYVLLFIKEHRLALLSAAIVGLGIGITGFFPSYAGLLVTTLIMSFGFHYFETVNQSLTLQYFTKEEAPMVFALFRSRTAACNIGLGLFFLIAAPFFSFTSIFLFFGTAICLLCLFAARIHPTSPDVAIQHKKMILRKKYWLFYLLTFLAGARRQIFVAFALFLLVKKFGFSVQEIAGLFLLNNIIGYLFNPYIGRAVVLFGERMVLSFEYTALFFIFLGYGFTDSKLTVIFLYIFDNFVFNFSLAIRTFFQKIADPADISPSMATGFTINHIAAVVIPAMGGIVWMLDYRLLFVGGAILSLASLTAVQWIEKQLPPEKK